MNDKQTLFFIGKCLTLRFCPDRVGEIRDVLNSGNVNWEKFVWISSNQLVLPALYLNLKNAKLLHELPDDLTSYMEELTDLNRERNQQIIEQSERLTSLLNDNGISPIYLKGTSHLLSGLYLDVGERMIGDIDILVKESLVEKSAEILLLNGYSIISGASSLIKKSHRHYPRLISKDYIAAIEIHRRIVEKPYIKNFNFTNLNQKKVKLGEKGSQYSLSEANEVIYNIMNVQMNDNSFLMDRVHLKHMYDLFLLAQKTDVRKSVDKFGVYFNKFNTYLHVSALLLGYPEKISFKSNFRTGLFVKCFIINLNHPIFSRAIKILINFVLRPIYYLKQILIASFNSERRTSLIYRMKSPKWFRNHLKTFKGF